MSYSTESRHRHVEEEAVEATTTDVHIPSSSPSESLSAEPSSLSLSETLEKTTTVQAGNKTKHNGSKKVKAENSTKPANKRKEKIEKRNKEVIVDKCADQDAEKLLNNNNDNNVDNAITTNKEECAVQEENKNNKTESSISTAESCPNDNTDYEEKDDIAKEERNSLASSVTEASQKPEHDGKIKAARKQVKKSVEEAKSFKNVINRTIFSILMAYIFLAVISMGLYAGLCVLIIIFVTMYHEIMRIPDQVYRRPKVRSVYVLKWESLFLTMNYILIYNFRKMFTSLSPQLEELGYITPFVGFCCILHVLVMFVLSLKKGEYRSQFTHFTWMVMTVSMLGAQFAGEVSNLMHGMIWFLLPVSCVINNDIWAYICGKLFGRTKLLALSPKKTVEGFVGASVFTVFWAFWFCGFLSYFPEMYCPVVSFTMSNNVQCERDSIFEQHTVIMPAIVQQLTAHHLISLRVSTAQMHAIVLGVFASLVAPFAGFFASGLKRAFKLKDFGDLIPGHGGMTDRMDCQGLMGLFTYFYLRTYIYKEHKCAALPQLLACALMLSSADKSKLITELQSSLHEA